MRNIRIIPRLDVKGPNLVKGIHLEGLRVLGKPEDFAYKYYTEGADELIYMDIVASLYGRNNLLEIVKKAAERIFIPLTAGGGIRTLDDMRELLRAGADKVAINTAAIRNPKFIKDAAKTFGSQCVVVSIEAKQRAPGEYEAFTDNGREKTGKDVLEWAKEAEALGAGEILITSIDREGTGKGYDLELVKSITDQLSIPVIACGGAGKAEDLSDVIQTASADAVCASSIFHYHHLETLESNHQYANEGNIEFLTKKRGKTDFLSKRISASGMPAIKNHLLNLGINCRLTQN